MRRERIPEQCLTDLRIALFQEAATLTHRMHSLCAGSVTQSCLTPCDPRDCGCQAPLSTEFFRQETRASCYFLLQGSFPDQGSNLCLLHLLNWEADSLPLGHPGGPMYSLQTIFQSLWTPGLCLSVSISNQTLSSPVILPSGPELPPDVLQNPADPLLGRLLFSARTGLAYLLSLRINGLNIPSSFTVFLVVFCFVQFT